MIIEIHDPTRNQSSITDFADKNKLVMEVHYRLPEDYHGVWHEYQKYYAFFRDTDIKQRSGSVAMFGNGNTPEEAITEYAKAISQRILIIRRNGAQIEVQVPTLTVPDGILEIRAAKVVNC